MRIEISPRSLILFPLVVLAGLGLGRNSSAGMIEYQFVVDASSIAGTTGSFDFQFNPASLPESQGATATVSGFSMTGGSLDPAASLTGDASGALPGPITLGNSTGFNEALQGTTFGPGFAFTLTLTGPAVDQPDFGGFGSTFSLSLLDSSFNPLLSGDPSGALLTVDLNSDGTTTVTTFAQAVTVVPEPSSLMLLGIAGITGMARFGRLHQVD